MAASLPFMPARRFAVAALAVLVLSLVQNATSAQAHVTNVVRAMRLAEQQEAATQRMSKEMLLVLLRVDREESIARLIETRAAFNRALTLLREGDTYLKIVPATDPAVVERLARVEKIWLGYNFEIQNLLEARPASKALAESIADLDSLLRNAVKELTEAFQEIAKHGDLYSITSFAISTCEHQHMLVEEISKEFLFVAHDQDTRRHRQRLAAAQAAFEANLAGLTNGDPQRRLIAPPTAEIRERLAAVQSTWRQASDAITAAIESGQPDTAMILKVNSEHRALIEQLNETIKLYEAL